jgi:hypothetical protein
MGAIISSPLMLFDCWGFIAVQCFCTLLAAVLPAVRSAPGLLHVGCRRRFSSKDPFDISRVFVSNGFHRGGHRNEHKLRDLWKGLGAEVLITI